MGRISDEMESAAKHARNEMQGNPKNSARLSMLIRLIQQSRIIRGYPEIELAVAAKQAHVWDSFGLHIIPDDDLPACFARALERLEGDGFAAMHIRDAWNSIRRERAEAAARDRQGEAMRYQESGITFAQWFEGDRNWIDQNLPPASQAMMKEIFEKRTANTDGKADQTPPPFKDCYIPPPPANPDGIYCAKCAPLSGLYWDDPIAKYRCCECEGGRQKAKALWGPKERK